MPAQDKQTSPFSHFDREQDDYIVRATAKNGRIRAFACRTTHLCQEALRMHQLSPISGTAFGRLLTGVLMLTQDLKSDQDNITAIVRGDGPLGGMTVIGQADASVRGFCQEPAPELIRPGSDKLTVGQAVGQGTLTMIKDLGMKEPYIGQVELISGEIAEDLTYYLAVSEQIPTAVMLGVRLSTDGIAHAGGVMVQLMPDADDDLAAWLEARVAGFPELTYWMEEGFDPHQILDLLLGDPEIRYLAATPCRYKCHCSRDRMARNLLTIGKTDLVHLAQDEQGITLECHFCDHKYHFTQHQLNHLIQETFTS